jgi:hypothetical protein
MLLCPKMTDKCKELKCDHATDHKPIELQAGQCNEVDDYCVECKEYCKCEVVNAKGDDNESKDNQGI